MTATIKVPKLEYVFTIRLEFGPRVKAAPRDTGVQRGYTRNSGGTIEGPRLNGIVVPDGGGDFPSFRPNGVVHFDSQYLLQADDGTIIVLKNRGCRHAPPDILKRMNAFDKLDPASYYFRVASSFDAPAGPHDWLNRTVIVGGADRNETFSIFTYYAVV